MTVRRERKDMVRNLERVLQAANELFAERGGNVTMEEVARRAGVGIGTVYRRFPSKEQLFAVVSHNVCDDTRNSLEQAADKAPDVVAKIHALTHTLYVRCEHKAALLEPTFQTVDGCTPNGEQRHLYMSVYEMLRHTIIEGQRQGVFSAGNAQIKAAFCTELLTPHAFHHLQQMTGAGADELAEEVAQFLLNGLGAE